MAVKDLALFKLAGSMLQKAKDKALGVSEKKLQESNASNMDESVQETFKAMIGKTKKPEVSEVDVSENLEIKTKEKDISKATQTIEPKVTETKTSKKVAKKAPQASKKKVAKDVSSKTADTKKRTVKKSTTAKTKSVKKETTMTKREEKIKLYTADIKKHYGSVDDAFLALVVKNLGPSIYRKDAELVSCSDPKELDTVRKNFLIKKLGYDKSETEMLDGEIQKVCETLKGVRNKYRATFYYILAKNLKKESALS